MSSFLTGIVEFSGSRGRISALFVARGTMLTEKGRRDFGCGSQPPFGTDDRSRLRSGLYQHNGDFTADAFIAF